MDNKAKYITETEEPTFLIEAIENACIAAVEAGESKEEIMIAGPGGNKNLRVTGTTIQSQLGGLREQVIVVDDLTELIQAEKDSAWSEMARRLAHEIKNPLTPIQLSAERLQRKLSTEVSGEKQEMLN